MSRTVLRNVTGLKFGWKHSIAITSRSLHKCNEVLNQKLPITFRVHVLHQEYWASSTVWYVFSAENKLNFTILCVKYTISLKGWIWCPTPAAAIFVNHPVQIKMAVPLSHTFTISEFSTGTSGDSPTSALWPLRVWQVWIFKSCLRVLCAAPGLLSSYCKRREVDFVGRLSTRSSSCYLVLSVLPVRLRPATFGITYHRRRFLQIFSQDS